MVNKRCTSRNLNAIAFYTARQIIDELKKVIRILCRVLVPVSKIIKNKLFKYADERGSDKKATAVKRQR